MSDIAPVETAPVETAPVETAPVETAPIGDVFDDAKVQSFDRGYVTKLREEAASHRTAYTPYKEAFGGYSEQERAVWFDLAKELTTNPKAAAEKFQQIAKAILGDGEPVPPVPVDGADKPLTQAELDARLKERDDAAQLRDLTAKIEAEATGLGYSKEDSGRWRDLMVTAQYETNGDLKAAHTALEAKKQAVIDSYLEGKKGGVTPPQNGGSAGQDADPIKSWSQASEAFKAAMANA